METVKPKEEESYQKPDDATLKKKLTSLQYEVTQKNGTERAFQNQYWITIRKESTWISSPVSPSLVL